MIGHKIYYEKTTGDVILITPEKLSENAINTTKEQDFQMYEVLAVRNFETVGMIQLEYGQYRAEIQSSRSIRVNPETEELLFEYPKYNPPLTEQVENLKQQNEQLQLEKEQLQEEINTLNENITLLEGTITELTAIIASIQGGEEG